MHNRGVPGQENPTRTGDEVGEQVPALRSSFRRGGTGPEEV